MKKSSFEEEEEGWEGAKGERLVFFESETGSDEGHPSDEDDDSQGQGAGGAEAADTELTADVRHWTVIQVQEWLLEIGVCSDVQRQFAEHRVDGQMLESMSDVDTMPSGFGGTLINLLLTDMQSRHVTRS